MSHKILSNQPITLPFSHFYTSPKLPYAPLLRTKIIPHLLVQSPPISPLVTGRKLEECTEIIVPVGGKVQINLKVNSAGLDDIGLGDDVYDQIRDNMIKLFKLNQTALGLSSLEPVINPTHSTSQPTLLILNPITSSPTHSILQKNIIPAGHPIAFLTGFDIIYEWGNYKPFAPNKIRTEDKEGEDHEEDGEEDEILLIDMPEDLNDQDGGNSTDNLFQRNHAKDEEETETQDKLQDKWLDLQLKEGLDRLIREHFIRRFPLIFDGGMIEYSSSFALPRALTSSVTQLLHLSNTYHTPLAREMKFLIKSISQYQEQVLNSTVHQAANLLARKNKKKRQSDSHDSNSSPSKRRKKSNEPSPPADVKETEDMEPLERAQRYMENIQERRKEWEGEGSLRTEKKLGRIIGDTFGQIGRSSFEERRRRGRLSYNKIKLQYDGTTTGDDNSGLVQATLTPDFSEQNDNQSMNSLLQMNQDSEDELLIGEDDYYEPFDEEDELLIRDDKSEIDEGYEKIEYRDNDDLLLLEEDDLDTENQVVEQEIQLLVEEEQEEEHPAGQVTPATQKETDEREEVYDGDEDEDDDEELLLLQTQNGVVDSSAQEAIPEVDASEEVSLLNDEEQDLLLINEDEEEEGSYSDVV